MLHATFTIAVLDWVACMYRPLNWELFRRLVLKPQWGRSPLEEWLMLEIVQPWLKYTNDLYQNSKDK